MKVVDELYLEYVRQQPCSLCAAPPPSQPHHLQARGMGGGSRLDVALGVLPLCVFCHQKVHNGNIHRRTLWELIDHKHGLEPGTAQVAVWKLLRREKRA